MLCAALTGCSAPMALSYTHDIETTVLIRTLAVDVGTQSLDGVGVTASSGLRPSVGSAPSQEPVVLSAQADTVSAARATMQTYGENELFFGNVEQMLVGEGLAQRGVDDFLTLMTRDFELRLDAQLWVVRGSSAADVLMDAQEGGGTDERLEAMEDDIKLSDTTLPRSGREALMDLRRNGATFLPALRKVPSRPGDGGKGEATILTAGYALLRDGALCSWTTPEESHGINLLLSQLDNEPVELTTPDSVKMAVNITQAQTSFTPRVDEKQTLVGLGVDCQIEARISEIRGGGLPQGEELDWLEAELAQRCQARIEEALGHAQALETDFFNLGRRAVMKRPWQKQAVERQWQDAFPTLEITVNVEAQVVRG